MATVAGRRHSARCAAAGRNASAASGRVQRNLLAVARRSRVKYCNYYVSVSRTETYIASQSPNFRGRANGYRILVHLHVRPSFQSHVPKQKLFHKVTGNSVDWERIDRREEDDGCVEDVERQANVTQCSFVDVRAGERLKCPSCSHEVNLMTHFRAVMMNLSHPPVR